MPWCPRITRSQKRGLGSKADSSLRASDQFQFAILSEQPDRWRVVSMDQSRESTGEPGVLGADFCMRRGIATKATRLLAEWAFRNTALNRLEIACRPKSSKSASCGKSRRGVGRCVARPSSTPGEMHDAVLFSIVQAIFNCQLSSSLRCLSL